MFRLLLTVCLTAIYVRYSSACMCIALADESKICASDFAIAGVVDQVDHIAAVEQMPNRNMTSSHHDFEYIVKIRDVFRSMKVLPTTMTVTSPGHTCGIHDLEVGAKYFITGRTQYDGQRYVYDINRCSSVIAKYREDGIPYRGELAVDVEPVCPEDGDFHANSDGGATAIATFDLGLVVLSVMAPVVWMWNQV